MLNNPFIPEVLPAENKTPALVTNPPANAAEQLSSQYLDSTLDKGAKLLEASGTSQFLASQDIMTTKEGVKNILAALALVYILNKAKKNWKPVLGVGGVLALIMYATKDKSPLMINAIPVEGQYAQPPSVVFGVRG